MNIYDRIRNLCSEKDITVKYLEQRIGLSESTISKWGKSIPSADKLDKVAEYFDVSIQYLLGKTDKRGHYCDPANTIYDPRLSARDQKDIAKKLEELENDLADYDATLMLSGEIMDDETRELLKASLANVVVIAKLKAKEKFNPNKNKNKDSDK